MSRWLQLAASLISMHLVNFQVPITAVHYCGQIYRRLQSKIHLGRNLLQMLSRIWRWRFQISIFDMRMKLHMVTAHFPWVLRWRNWHFWFVLVTSLVCIEDYYYGIGSCSRDEVSLIINYLCTNWYRLNCTFVSLLFHLFVGCACVYLF